MIEGIQGTMLHLAGLTSPTLTEAGTRKSRQGRGRGQRRQSGACLTGALTRSVERRCDRTGKCTEYTTLFGSLARAAGIPTRVALGQRRFAGGTGDSWGGHMWNEVFVGEWIPVDASANEVGGSTSLLKFVHSDTVAGSQPLRRKLTESLGLSIVEHTVLERTAPGFAVATGLVGRTYTDAEHAFRIDLPGDDWSVRQPSRAT